VAEAGVEEVGVPAAGACVQPSGGAPAFAGEFCAAGAEAGGAVWPMSDPASTGKATRSRKMRNFIGTICSELISLIIVRAPALDRRRALTKQVITRQFR
jgi:hypothetical protein